MSGKQCMKQHSQTSCRTACIFCNGELRGLNLAKSLAAQAELLIAADGGAEYLDALDLKPDAIIGDMDSLRDDPWPDDQDIQRIRLPRDKNQCDGELAVEWAFEQGCHKTLLLGAWGGRLDQALGNCALLMRLPGRLALWDRGVLAQAVTAEQEMVLSVASGTSVSLIPFAEGTRVRTKGLKYVLNDEPIKYATHGISNVATESHPSVAVTKGMILLCVEGGETWLSE